MNKLRRLFLVAILVFIAGCERMDTVENVYPSRQAAVDAGAVERGWVPAFLPPSVKEVREKHNLDTNEVWTRFLTDSDALESLKEHCQAVKLELLSLPRGGGSEWWPSSLTDGGQPEGKEYSFFRCSNDASLALKEKEGFYWRTGRKP